MTVSDVRPVGPDRPAEDPLLEVRDLHVDFTRGSHRVQAVAGLSFTIRSGETLGLVGESGCGKSTTGRAIVQVVRPTSGSIVFAGTDLGRLRRRAMRRARTGIQMIFQDPVSSLNPRRRVGGLVSEPLDIWRRGTKQERATVVHEMLEAVGLDPEAVVGRRPREFSGGQCQRISIARGSCWSHGSSSAMRSSRRSTSRSKPRS